MPTNIDPGVLERHGTPDFSKHTALFDWTARFDNVRRVFASATTYVRAGNYQFVRIRFPHHNITWCCHGQAEGGYLAPMGPDEFPGAAVPLVCDIWHLRGDGQWHVSHCDTTWRAGNEGQGPRVERVVSPGERHRVLGHVLIRSEDDLNERGGKPDWNDTSTILRFYQLFR